MFGLTHESEGNGPYTLKDAQSFVSIVLGGSPEQYLPDTSLKDSGLDSLSTMELVNYINERKPGAKFKPSDINNDQFTVQSIVDVIVAARDGDDLMNDEDVVCKIGADEEASIESSDVRSLDFVKELSNERVPLITLQISPAFIDFDSIISALKSAAEIIVLRQSDPKIL